MIRDLTSAVVADLSARKCPYPVTYGPERVAHDGFSAAIVFRRDRSSHELVTHAVGRPRRDAPQGPADDAPAPFTRDVAGAFVVYARSPKPGATVGDHEEECDAVCDIVLTAMHRVLVGRRLPLTITESKLLTRAELQAEAEDGRLASADPSGLRSADFPGCAARVRFTVRTLVRDVTYTGQGGGTGTIYQFAPPVVDAE